MLHLELLESYKKSSSPEWIDVIPEGLKDPTEFLISAVVSYNKFSIFDYNGIDYR